MAPDLSPSLCIWSRWNNFSKLQVAKPAFRAFSSMVAIRYSVAVHTVANALKIAFESFSYRVHKHEANNLLATLSMLLAFRVEGLDLILRVLFAVLLNLVIYLLNDYCDLDVDLHDAQKSQPKTVFMAENRHASQLALLTELLLLAGVSVAHVLVFGSALLPVAAVVNVGLYHAYSRWLKRIPIVDVLAMTVAGATSTVVGAPAGIVGAQLLGMLALMSGAYEVIQVIRDVDSDERQGVRTTAVLLGPGHAAWLFRAIVLAAALLGVVIMGRLAAALFVLAIFVPLGVDRAARSWDVARVIFGLSWLGLLAEVYLAP